jgi:four helix bundle suffix protein
MEKQFNPDGFIPKRGGYEKLITYQKSVVIYDGTQYFCKKYFRPFDRTIDQMVQAARSGKQNILEGSMASGTSKETEIKLTTYLLAKQITSLEKEFLQEGGLRERMSKARINIRKNMK